MIKYQILYKHHIDADSLPPMLWTSHIDLNQAYREADHLDRMSTRQSYWIEEIIVNSIDNEYFINLTLNDPLAIYNNCVIKNCKIINGSFFNCTMYDTNIDLRKFNH